ncbi:MAG: adenylate/guanylate cyclase domain-containing protein [Candidatus Dormibacteria bacterium]
MSIAYQVLGDGPFDLIYVPGWVSHLDLQWEDPLAAAHRRRLASIARLIMFDKRGTGLSDRDVGDSTLEERMDDLRAVLDAAGSERAVVYGRSEGGPLALMFATTYPERTLGLILDATLIAGPLAAPDFPPAVEFARILGAITSRLDAGSWGKGEDVDLFTPDRADDGSARSAAARLERASASPGTARKHLEWVAEMDCRPLAALVQAPTLIIHRTNDPVCPVSAARWLADSIPGAELRELSGNNHGAVSISELNDLLDAVEEFLTGSRQSLETDRILATVLFTDIVNSTIHLADVGDRRWAALLTQHHEVIRHELERFRGVWVDSAGDGVMARFDGPARAVRCALAIGGALRPLGIVVRAGIHTGECELVGDSLAGIAVHIAARVNALAGPGEVLVSSTVKDLVAGSGLGFVEAGTHQLKGIPGEWRLSLVAGGGP